jgi:hypothetical protein
MLVMSGFIYIVAGCAEISVLHLSKWSGCGLKSEEYIRITTRLGVFIIQTLHPPSQTRRWSQNCAQSVSHRLDKLCIALRALVSRHKVAAVALKWYHAFLLIETVDRSVLLRPRTLLSSDCNVLPMTLGSARERTSGP